MLSAPPQPVAHAVTELIGRPATAWRPISGGYTPAARWRADFGGRGAFVKMGTTPLTADMLRREARAYEQVRGTFLPDFIGWVDDPATPVLVIEDLGDGIWPPPWTDAAVAAALAAIADMHEQRPDLPRFGDGAVLDGFGGWRAVQDDPLPFLGLGLVSRAWLERHLDALVEAEAACITHGDALTHFDLRSDNMCLTPAGMKLVDWAEACRGNPRLDIGFWLPSLHFEGGPPPEAVLPDAPEIAAWVAGFFAARAGLPDIPDAPRVRLVQRQQLATALPWAQRALGLSPLRY